MHLAVDISSWIEAMHRSDDAAPAPSRHPFFDTLASALEKRPRRALDRHAHAAILVPIVDDGGPLRLILTRRTEALPTHAGQVAFPGGGIDPRDAGPVETALREAEEEIALPRDRPEVVGLLDDFPTVTDEMRVTPVVARLPGVPPLKPDPREVARIFDIPLEPLTDPKRWVVRDFEKDGRIWPVYFFDHDGETLWGLSAYVVLHLLDLSNLPAPFPLPKVRFG
jgi:8-oxo-dGTP pyrophosphatase MutT (NUDIX family)